MNTLALLGIDNPAVKLWLRLDVQRHGCKLQCGPYAWDLLKDSRVIRIGRGQFASAGHLATQFDALFKTLVASQAGDLTLLDFSRVHTHTYRALGVTFELAKWPESNTAIDAYFEWYAAGSGDLVFDIGAECGIATYVLSRLTGRVVAFEPDVRLRVILQRNVNRHSLANVTVANDSLASLAELIAQYGRPAFCKINLDEVTPEFLRQNAHTWLSMPMLLAARSNSANVRQRFEAFLKEGGFETNSNEALGMVWGRRVTHGSP